jgi:hypothetical protein
MFASNRKVMVCSEVPSIGGFLDTSGLKTLYQLIAWVLADICVETNTA